MTESIQVVTRFAPSPTGFLHVGNYRTALFAYLYARQHGGKFILRIEDTDKARSKKEYEDNIVESLKWLGLEYDEFYRQSDRSAIHATYIQKLIDGGHAYISKEIPKEPGDRAEVIRFKNPNTKVKWNDIIRGETEFDTTELGDFVIARSMSEPIFHLVVIVDDHEMGVTHIIRGEDHISNTPRHILIQRALSIPEPLYAHLPLLLANDRSKMSKRKGALPVSAYRDLGYLKEAMVNYMALLGWNPGATAQDQEIFSIDELIKIFSLEKVQKSGAMFSEEKLKWVNRAYIAKLSDEEFLKMSEAFYPNLDKKFITLVREKIATFAEIPVLFSQEGELSFVSGTAEYKKESLMWRQETDISKTKAHLKKSIDFVTSIDNSNFNQNTIKAVIWPYAEEQGKGNVLWPMRYALSGKDRSPDPFVIAHILGKEETLRRLKIAHDAI